MKRVPVETLLKLQIDCATCKGAMTVSRPNENCAPACPKEVHVHIRCGRCHRPGFFLSLVGVVAAPPRSRGRGALS